MLYQLSYNHHKKVVRVGIEPTLSDSKTDALPLGYRTISMPKEGLEPPNLAAPDPKSGVSANSTIWANGRGDKI